MTQNSYLQLLEELRAFGVTKNDVLRIDETWGWRDTKLRQSLSHLFGFDNPKVVSMYRSLVNVVCPSIMILSSGYVLLGWWLAPTYWITTIFIFFGALTLYIGIKKLDDFIAGGYIWTLCPQKSIETGSDLDNEGLRAKYQTLVDGLAKRYPDLAIQEADARYWSDVRSYLVLSGPTWSIVLK